MQIGCRLQEPLLRVFFFFFHVALWQGQDEKHTTVVRLAALLLGFLRSDPIAHRAVRTVPPQSSDNSWRSGDPSPGSAPGGRRRSSAEEDLDVLPARRARSGADPRRDGL